MSSVPGLRGVEHVGFNVPDLEQAVGFFVDVIGCERLYDLGAAHDREGTWMADNLDVHPRAEIHNFALLRCVNGANFEIFEYEAPDQVQRWPRMSDYGGYHVSFYVDDMDAALAYLESKNVKILGGKKPGRGAEAGEGSTFAHFLTPWGQMLEFVSYPYGRDFFKTSPRWTWRPD